MLDYARQRACEVLNIPRTAILATTGPAGLQVSEFPCEASGLDLFLLLPNTSDHLFNLELDPSAALLTALWELQGQARVISPDTVSLRLLESPERAWSVLVHVAPARIHILRDQGWGSAETLDLSTHP